jgi:hypothetical protein
MRIFAAKMHPYFVGALLIPFSFATISLPARDAPHSRFYSASSFDEIQSPAPARRSAFTVLTDGWRKIAIALTTPESPLHWAAGRQLGS